MLLLAIQSSLFVCVRKFVVGIEKPYFFFSCVINDSITACQNSHWVSSSLFFGMIAFIPLWSPQVVCFDESLLLGRVKRKKI